MIWLRLSHCTSSPLGWCRQECWCSQLLSSSPLTAVLTVHSFLQHKDMNCHKRSWFTSGIYKAPEAAREMIANHSAQVHSTLGRSTALASTSQLTGIEGQGHTSAGEQHHDKRHEQHSSAHTTSSFATFPDVILIVSALNFIICTCFDLKNYMQSIFNITKHRVQ